MGGLPLRCPPLLADPQMTNYLIALLLVLVSSASSAASVALVPPAGIASTAGGFSTAASFTGQFSAAAFNSNFTTQVAGKAVTIPASMRMAANAGQFAVSAVRLNPSALVGGAVAAWLLSKGIEYINGQFQKAEPIAGYTPGTKWCAEPGMSYEYCDATPDTTCSTYFSRQPPDWRGSFAGCQQLSSTSNTVAYRVYFSGYTINSFSVMARTDSCVAGSRYVTGKGCIGLAVPMTDPDWANIASGALPDSVASELAPKGVAIPLEAPKLDPVDIPLGDPQIDPKTGKRYQDKARITPQADAKTADVQTYKQEVDANGDPATDPNTQAPKAPEEQTDPCKLNPDAAGCKPLDDAEAPDLEKKENPFSLNPVSGFGADNAACPAPQTLFSKGGQTITWDWGKFCGFAQGIRPLIIGFAWLTALMIVVSVGRRNG